MGFASTLAWTESANDAWKVKTRHEKDNADATMILARFSAQLKPHNKILKDSD